MDLTDCCVLDWYGSGMLQGREPASGGRHPSARPGEPLRVASGLCWCGKLHSESGMPDNVRFQPSACPESWVEEPEGH